MHIKYYIVNMYIAKEVLDMHAHKTDLPLIILKGVT